MVTDTNKYVDNNFVSNFSSGNIKFLSLFPKFV